MIKIDLVTGFLGSGKTTFIRNYAKYLTSLGLHIGIVENDFGAVNVDMLILQDLESEQCELEPIVGGNDPTDWKRRFKAKLILFALQGVDRVVVEPSGIYDVNTFKEILYDESVSSKYEIGTIVTIVDAKLDERLSKKAETLLVSQIASCGQIVLSKGNNVSEHEMQATVHYLSNLLETYHCDRKIENCIFRKNWDEMNEEDYQLILNSGWIDASYQGGLTNHKEVFDSLFFMNSNSKGEEMVNRISQLFQDASCGTIFRIKGFFRDKDGNWMQVNATREHLNMGSVNVGQDVIIVIGENLKKEVIETYLQ